MTVSYSGLAQGVRALYESCDKDVLLWYATMASDRVSFLMSRRTRKQLESGNYKVS